MNKKQIENIVWHIETNRIVAGDKRVLDDVLKSLKNFLKETAQEVPVQEQFLNKISKSSKTLLLETLLGNDVTIFVKEDREFFEVDFVDSNNRVRLLTMNLEKLSKCRYCLLSYQSS